MLRTVLLALAFATALSWAPAAHAECAQPYPGDQLVNDLQVMQLALRNLDEVTFGTAGKRLDVGIACLTSAAPSPVFASAYRYLGVYYMLVGNDETKARRWFRTALEIDPTYMWDASELELGHPARAVFEQERQAAGTDPTPIAGKVVNQPAGSKITIDGRPLAEASATLDRPHVIQQVGTDKGVRGSWLVEGNQIPAQFLRDEMAPAQAEVEATEKAAKEKKSKTKTSSQGLEVQQVERLRPPEKTPLIIGGVLGVLGAGGVYAASFAAREQFDHATTTEDLERTRTTTNALVLASGGVLLLGAGIGYWGIILDGGAGVGLAGRF